MLRSSPYLAALVLGLLAAPSAFASEAANAASESTKADSAVAPAAAEPDAEVAPHVDTDDSYLDADFPNAKSVEVEPPVVSEGRRRRSRSYAGSSSSDARYSGSGDKDWRPEKRPKKPTGPSVPERGAFVAGALDVLFVSDRYTLTALGVTGGTYVGGRLRLAGLVGFPIDFDRDGTSELDKPRVLFGGSLGVALVRRASFALSLSADVSTTELRDYGWNLGIGMPLEWVTKRGFRVGFIPTLLQNVGSAGASECYIDYGNEYCTSTSSSSRGGLQLQGSIGMVFR